MGEVVELKEKDTYVIYKRSVEHDLMLLGWWGSVTDSGEIHTMLHPITHPLSAFLLYFQLPRALFFKQEERNIWFALWAEPFLDGAAIGLWVSPEKRRTRAALRSFLELIDVLVREYNTLLAVSRRKDFTEMLGEAAGFEHVGRIDGVFGGDDVNIVQLTKEAWDRRRGVRNGA